MATLNNFVQGDIEDAIVTAYKTALDGVTHPLGGTGSFVVGSYANTFEEFVKTQSGLQVCWIHLRNATDTAMSALQFERKLDYRVKVAVPYGIRQEKTDAQVKSYLYLLRKALYTSTGTNRTWSGNAIDSYMRDEQDFTLADPAISGFEVTLTVTTYFWYT